MLRLVRKGSFARPHRKRQGRGHKSPGFRAKSAPTALLMAPRGESRESCIFLRNRL
jgi:hypothetical protein